MFTLEALNADHGDCLLLHYELEDTKRLWLIDGGPTATYARTLRPRLKELEKERGNDELFINLLVVTHIDDDHIDGITKLTGALTATTQKQETPNVRFGQVWFNGFVATFGSAGAQGARVAQLASADLGAVLGDHEEFEKEEATAFLQGVADGDKLMENLKNRAIAVTPNVLFSTSANAKAVAPREFDDVFGANVTVITPTAARLDALKTKWAKETKLDIGAGLANLARGGIDRSVANLSSIVMLVEIGGKTVLLTGDGLAKHILESWEAMGKGETPIDIMKVPHHGAEGNNSVALFKMFPAAHYVFCANGKHDNPDMSTLKMLFEARAGASFTVHMTATKDNPGTSQQTAYLEQMKAASGGKVDVIYREENALSISITPS